MKKRLLSLLLALTMLLSLVSTALAADSGFAKDADALPAVSTDGPLSLPQGNYNDVMDVQSPAANGQTPVTLPAADVQTAATVTDSGLTKLENGDDARFSETEGVEIPTAEDLVTFIVVMKDEPLLEMYSADEIAAQTSSVTSYEKKQLSAIDSVKAELTSTFGAEEGFELGYTYTIATTGVSVTTTYGNRAAIEAMPGVEYVYVAPTFRLPEDGMDMDSYEPMTSNASTMVGAGTLNELGYTGKGMRIAILDTGLLITHPSFAALPENVLTETSLTQKEVEKVWDSLNASTRTEALNAAYYNTKIPFRFNYDAGSFDVSNTYAGSDHGTHVAGIAAANVLEDVKVRGVAPDAQIIAMQVFSTSGGADWSVVMAALEDCVRLHVDSVNMSLGSAAGFVDPKGNAMLDVMELFEDSDIQLLIAAGNDTNNAYQNLTGINMSKITDPDNGLVGNPSTYSAPLSVASADNDAIEQLYFTVAGQEIGYNDSAKSSATIFINQFANQTLEYVVVPGYGEQSDYADIDVKGKVALVSRGSTSFPDKQSIAQENGAIACVVYNNVKGAALNMQINDGGDNIPCVAISMAHGKHMIANATDGKGTLTVCNYDVKSFKSDRTMSDFSSWGAAPDLTLKPEITGVGGSIYSSVDPAISGSNYGYMSGTSMATPQITGAMAVLIQYLEENYPEITGAQQRRVAANLLMSTANPVMYSETLEYSPRLQGAGLADLVKATTTPVYFSNPDAKETRAKVEFGDDPDKNGEYEFSFEITNLSDNTVTYEFSSSILTETIYEGEYIAAQPYGLDAKIQVAGNVSESFLKYDFNDDGRITTADARVLLRHVTGKSVIASDDKHFAYLDVNGDGTVDRDDVKVITDYCAELEVAVDLLDKVTVGGNAVNQVSVPAGETLKLYATLELTQQDRDYLEKFPNGIYVEGYLYAVPVDTTDAEGVTGPQLTMPLLGFYGDWSDAPVFDDGDEASLYPVNIYTGSAQLGTNPYIRASQRSGDLYNAFSYASPLSEIDMGLLRNAKKIKFTVTDQTTGEEYWSISGNYITKTYYYSSYGMIFPFYVLRDEGEVWDGTVGDGEELPDGTKITYTTEAWLDDGDDIVDDSFSFNATLDSFAPEVLNKDSLQQSLKTEGDRTYLTLELKDNQYIAAVLFVNPDGIIMGKSEVDNVPGEAKSFDFDVTGFGTEFTIVVADYACNETEIDAVLNPGDHKLDNSTLAQLDKGRIYGCETFDLAVIEPGWFSANKEDLSDYRNETYDSTNRYYAAEYVNGYVIAQSAVTGDLMLVTPSGSYWGQQTLVSQNGKSVGENGVWVFYDMALDYSDKGSDIYDQWDSCLGKDTLYAVGWMYRGDNNGDGKDDGYNALFRIWVSKWNGSVFVDECAKITGTDDGAELLTLGCTTEGDLYGIDTNGKLYSLDPQYSYDSEVGADVVTCSYIGTTDFVNKVNYSGVNVIQSMGYDHNTDKMYWYAHSQTAAGSYYINVCQTYTIDLATAKCTEVGTYGEGGQTCLFVPTDLESDLFEMGVKPESFSMDSWKLTMVENQTRKLDVNWSPWNATPGTLTWESGNPDLATVDEFGFVTAHKAGTVTITATGKVWDKWAGEYDSTTYTYSGEWVDSTATCEITIVESEDAIYSYIVADFKNSSNDFNWVTYSDKTPSTVTKLASQTVTDEFGNTGTPMWQGGAYYNGYVYTIQPELMQDGDTAGAASILYRTKVTQGETPAQTTFGDAERIGGTLDVEIGNLGFDYNTGRMYGVDLTYGGLAIIDLDTGNIDRLGTFSGDIGGPAIAPAMCVTADGTIVISDMSGNLYTVNPDNMYTTNIGSLGTDTWYYAAMTYDYNTGSIYWNPCMSQNLSSLYLVRLEPSEWDPERLEANIMKIGNVSTKAGVEQTAMFTIPANEPETKQIPVESIEITNGDNIYGLVGGTAQLETITTPTRPTVRTCTWESSDEGVVKVDRSGVLTYTGVGTATVTATIANKNPEDGGPFSDTISVTVYEAAGEMAAFLTSDSTGSQFYDFWLTVKDYDVQHSTLGETSINIYSLRVGAYYDGYIYGYNEQNQFIRIDADNHSRYTYLGTNGLDLSTQSVAGMAIDYTTGTMYAVTRETYNTKGRLCTVNLDDGSLTEIATLSDFVFALAVDAKGTLYAAGSPDMSTEGALYTVDTTNGVCTKVLDLPGAYIWTGEVYYGNQQYNPVMTYDYGTNRLYLNATNKTYWYESNSGVYMIQLDEEPWAINLGKLAVQTRAGSTVKVGDAMLGLLASIPEDDEVPVGEVNGIIMSKKAGRVAADGTMQLSATVRPSNAENQALTWSSSDETVATVDENGLVTAVSSGKADITATSAANGAISSVCTVTVVDLSGSQSVAYTASATKDKLYSFNPALPASTATVIGDFSGGTNIKGMAMGDGCIYYVVDLDASFSFYLYRYDLTTKQSTMLGSLETWTGIQDIAYDKTNDILYGVGGFYIYQYTKISEMNGSRKNIASYMDVSYSAGTTSAVSCDEEGNVYIVGNNWGTNALVKTDKLFSTKETLAEGFSLGLVPGKTEMAYDSSLNLFYITDASNNLYTLSMDGTVEMVDVLGDGIDINGLAIVPAQE